MHSVFKAFYLSIFIAAIRKIFRKAVPDISTEMEKKFVVVIPYGEYYVCGTFVSQVRARHLAQKIAKLTSYNLEYDITVEQFRLKHPGETFASIFANNGTFIMPPDTPTIRKMCQAEGQDPRSTTL